MTPARGVEAVIFVFKAFAVLVLIGGVLTIVAAYAGGIPPSTGAVTAMIAGTVLGAATFLFFAYILDLLLDIHDIAEATADGLLSGDDEPEEAAAQPFEES